MKPKSIINEWSTTKNFWLLHPELKADEIFEQYYRHDKSKGHNKSSKLMWFVAYCYDSGSTFWGMPENGVKGVLASMSRALWVKGKTTDPDNFSKVNSISIKELKDRWVYLTYNPGDLMLLNWRENMEDRDEVIKETKYRFDDYNDEGKLLKGNVKEFDEMISRTRKMYDELEAIEATRAKESNDGKSFGGSKDSISDSGAI